MGVVKRKLQGQSVAPIGLEHGTHGTRGAGVKGFIASDGGFTSLGVMIATLLVLALLFSSSQVYWIGSNSADIQFAADAGALAAENVVAEYLVVARVVDAVVLSMSLLGLTLYAVSAIAACIPYVDTLVEPLYEAAETVSDARDAFAQTAIEALDRLQQALPFLCAANAAATIAANGSASSLSASYVGLAIPLPIKGEATKISEDEMADEMGDTVGENNAEVSEAANRAEKAREAMNEAKMAGYLADCGSAGGCLRERANALAGLTGTENPYYQSLDTWGFDIAIEREKAYYAARIEQEEPHSGDIDELVRSIARKRFYRYAYEQVSHAYVSIDASGVTTASIPFLPQNTADMRSTYLYTERAYPLSAAGGVTFLHACVSCPAYGTSAGAGALCDIDSGVVVACDVCDFSIETLGGTPSASTSIDNGFEYYYKRVAEAAALYSEAARDYEDATIEARGETSESFDIYKRALDSLSETRYDPDPPGRGGCIAIVIDTSAYDAPVAFGHFVSGSAQIGMRVACSAAMLAPDDPEMGSNVISSLLSGLNDSASESSGGIFLDGVVSLWGDLLLSYLEGTEGCIDGITGYLERFPLIGSSDLATWAENELRDTLELVGLQPVEMESLKPVLVNTTHVLAASPIDAVSSLASIRMTYTSMPGSGSGTIGGSLFDGLVSLFFDAASDTLDDTYVIATIEFAEGFPGLDISVSLPAGVVDAGNSALATFETKIRSLGSMIEGGERAWN